MADRPNESRKPKAEPKKKQPGTVLLTPEELRAVSGGYQVTRMSPAKIDDVEIVKGKKK
jgi:hypothetical protein